MKSHSAKRQHLLRMLLFFPLLFSAPNCSSSRFSRIAELDREIITAAQWGGTAAADSHKTHEIKFITLHHGGEEYLGDKPTPAYLVNLQNWSRADKKWIDIPYHFLIDLEGKIYAGRDLRYPGDTNTAYDPTGHALICVLGNYEIQHPSKRQREAVIDLFTWLCWRYQISPETIAGHKDVAEGTVCPGKNLYVYLTNGEFKQETARRLQHLQARQVHDEKAGSLLLPLLRYRLDVQDREKNFTYDRGGIVRGNRAQKDLALVFTGDSFAEGGEHIRQALARHQVRGSFFFTGNFYRRADFRQLIKDLAADGHYLGAHSDAHLLYCPWENRDSLLVTRAQFEADLAANYRELENFGVSKARARYFLPPYEWYNEKISAWSNAWGATLVNFTPGTRSHADYTYPEMAARYLSSEKIMESIWAYERKDPDGLNGFILLIHIGTDPRREDKLYLRLDELLAVLHEKGYRCKRIDELLGL